MEVFKEGRDDKKYRLSWLMSRSEAEDFDIGDEVAIKLEVQKTVDNESEDSKGDGKKSAKKVKIRRNGLSNQNGPIQGKEYVPELKQYRYWWILSLKKAVFWKEVMWKFRLQIRKSL